MNRAFIGGHPPIAGNGAPQVKQQVLSHGVMGAPQLIIHYNEQQFTCSAQRREGENHLGWLNRIMARFARMR